jgi:hypothetical protein
MSKPGRQRSDEGVQVQQGDPRPKTRDVLAQAIRAGSRDFYGTAAAAACRGCMCGSTIVRIPDTPPVKTRLKLRPSALNHLGANEKKNTLPAQSSWLPGWLCPKRSSGLATVVLPIRPQRGRSSMQ